MHHRLTVALLSAVAAGLAITASAARAADLPLEQLVLPPGFSIEVLIDDVPNARQIALGDQGTLFVGTRREGKVYAIANALTEPESARVIASGLTMPSGVAVQGDDLYVGAVNRILRFGNIEQNLGRAPATRPVPEVVTDSLPTEGHHGWKYLKFGPDGALYVPVGAPCNICLSKDQRFASLLRMDPATGATKLFAEGIRNTVGFDWHPASGALWFTDNGRDLLGDDVPPDEINRATAPGQHFGYPFVHAGTIPDPEFAAQRDAAIGDRPLTAPALNLQAHSAALGIDFYEAGSFPAAYRGALFVAEHGSWNRSEKVGFRVSVVLNPDTAPVYEPFVEGWLQGQDNWGRPNDVLVTKDGSLLISDDQAGAIYRVRYTASAVADAQRSGAIEAFPLRHLD